MTIDKKFVDDHMQDKNILYIPIISSINRETNKYNLDSDGNEEVLFSKRNDYLKKKCVFIAK